MTREFKFKNGDVVREIYTGFTGTITGTVFYITGCNQYLITAKSTTAGDEPKSLWYDEGRLAKISVSDRLPFETEENGCDKQAPIK